MPSLGYDIDSQAGTKNHKAQLGPRENREKRLVWLGIRQAACHSMAAHGSIVVCPTYNQNKQRTFFVLQLCAGPFTLQHVLCQRTAYCFYCHRVLTFPPFHICLSCWCRKLDVWLGQRMGLCCWQHAHKSGRGNRWAGAGTWRPVQEVHVAIRWVRVQRSSYTNHSLYIPIV